METILLALVQLAGVVTLLLIADRWLHRHLQGVMHLLTGDEELAMVLYAIILFPGVALHELSHAFLAIILGVGVGKIHLLPQREGGRIRLGYVPVEETGAIRASLIGAAPLIFGGLAVVLIGQAVFGTPEMIDALASGQVLSALEFLPEAFRATNAWLWGYLIFTVGNTMLPSRSDIHAWPQMALLLAIFVVAILLIGGSGVVMNGVGSLLALTLNWIILLGVSTLLVDVPVFFSILLLQKLIERIKGVRLEFRS